MNLTLNRRVRAARKAYFALDEDPGTDTARTTLRYSSDPAERHQALAFLAERELGLYRLHNDAFGYTPWPGDTAGDAATGLAYGVMVLRLLCATERARATGTKWLEHYELVAWGRNDLVAAAGALADACTPHLDRLSAEKDPTEIAVLYARLWIAAYPIIGGQAAEWIASLGNDWECMAAGVQDGPETVLVLPNDRRGAVQHMPAADPTAG